MHTPYTLDFLGAFIAAQTGAALLLTALLLFWRASAPARGFLFLAVWLATVAVAIIPTASAVGFKPGPHLFREALAFSALLTTVGALLMRRPVVAVLALAAQWPLWLLTGFIKESDCELAAVHLGWIGLVIGLLVRPPAPAAAGPTAAGPTRDEDEGSYRLHDLTVFALATLLAAFVSVYVMGKRDGSADEWAYTFQAAVFAKGRAYAEGTRCQNYLDTYYVFENMGRVFSQYTPGWPLFVAPFVRLHAIWLSGPFSMGLMVWGMARLGRSAMRSFAGAGAPLSPRVIRAAGTWAAVLSMLGTTILVNGGSRYPHVFVTALYAWSLEGLLVVSTPGLSRREQVWWGIVLGSAAGLMAATRPADGAFLGLGIAVLFVYAFARRRVGWRALASTAAALALWTALTLVILRLQLGKWWTTGYSLLAANQPWAAIKYSLPEPNQWKYGLPFATASYCWWPCSMPLGLAGLAMMRGRGRGLAIAMAVGCLPYTAYITAIEFGRGFDWGYGPRYAMVWLVPLAIGGAVALAQLSVAARRHTLGGRTALARGGPMALALFAVVGTWFRIVPLVWPPVAEHTRRHGSLQRAIEEAHLRNAVVIAGDNTTGFSDLDLATDLPVDLYPDQDAIIAIERHTPREAWECLRSAFPGRTIYAASGYEDVRIVPWKQ
ncbi:MAG TPA: hypothetical protein VIF09_06820 [Polyangiaceae bacterium]